jgi:SAM-dependent methyltransferase
MSRDQDSSAFLRRSLPKIKAGIPGVIADIACGFGRNAFYLARRGFEIECLDNDNKALEHISKNNTPCCNLKTIKIDFDSESLPFSENSLAGAICVHSWGYNWCNEIIESISPMIKKGGFIFVETVANRGGNYMELPRSGYIRDKVERYFNIVDYTEKKAGPENCDAVTVKAFAIKI